MHSSLAFSAALLVSMTGSALAQSTAFTYQGRLTNAGQPATGTYDMRFRLYNALAGGSQPGPTFCADNVAVSGGLFTVVVDVGQQFATGEARFLEVDVRPDTGQSCANTAGFTTLTPRQSLTDTPRAMVANIAHALAIPNGSTLNAVALDNSGNVGMGTASPTSHLDIVGTQDALKLRGPEPFMTLVDTASSNTRVLLQNSGGRYYVVSESFLNGTNTGGFTLVDPQGRLGVGTHNPAGPLEVWVTGGQIGLQVADTGNVGIGTSSPAAKLDVNGNARVAGTITHGAVTRAYTIHATELMPRWGTASDAISYDESGVVDSRGGVQDVFYASPHLPDGATVIALTLFGHDSYPTGDMTCTLGRTNFSGAAADMAAVVTNLGGQAWQTTGISFPVIDNANHGYWVRLNMGGGVPNVFEHRVYAVRILYSITQPLP